MSQAIRRFHRAMAVVFIVVVLANVAAWYSGFRATWAALSAFVPLGFLMLSGSYLLARPYLSCNGLERDGLAQERT